MIRARKTLSGISLGFDSCSEWISATVGFEKWTIKSTLCLLNAAADRRLLALNPVRHAAFLDLQVHSRCRILAVRPGRNRALRAAPRSVPTRYWEESGARV